VYVVTGEWGSVQPVTAAVQIALALQRLWPEQFGYRKLGHLLGSAQAVEAIGNLAMVSEIVALWTAELHRFAETAQAFWLYQ